MTKKVSLSGVFSALGEMFSTRTGSYFAIILFYIVVIVIMILVVGLGLLTLFPQFAVLEELFWAMETNPWAGLEILGVVWPTLLVLFLIIGFISSVMTAIVTQVGLRIMRKESLAFSHFLPKGPLILSGLQLFLGSIFFLIVGIVVYLVVGGVVVGIITSAFAVGGGSAAALTFLAILLGIGFILGIGLLFARIGFFPFYIVDKGQNFFSALGSSFRDTTKNTWRIWAIFVLFSLIIFLITLPFALLSEVFSDLLSLLAAPLWVLLPAYMYLFFTDALPESTEDEQKEGSEKHKDSDKKEQKDDAPAAPEPVMTSKE